jgi:ubiquinone/menaquinone biosynthesis C-methylase UbiE
MSNSSTTASEIQSKSDRSNHRFFHNLPSSIQRIVKGLYYLVIDSKYYLLREKGTMIPPPSNSGMANYLEIGKEFFNYFIDYGGLKKSDRVLDIGCATGRMALPLTSFLSKEGSYIGFDLQQKQIDWAKKNITTKFPNFEFHKVDVVNPIYSDEGEKAEGFIFPYEDSSFDFIFLTSVFTHMLPEDVEHYLSEIQRVLKIGGRCFSTFFLINNESKDLLKNGFSTIDFQYPVGECLTDNLDAPEEAIAYKEEIVRAMLKSKNLEIIEPIKFGSWCGREEYLSYQDIILTSKAPR